MGFPFLVVVASASDVTVHKNVRFFLCRRRFEELSDKSLTNDAAVIGDCGCFFESLSTVPIGEPSNTEQRTKALLTKARSCKKRLHEPLGVGTDCFSPGKKAFGLECIFYRRMMRG
jgi:hypothetical protein